MTHDETMLLHPRAMARRVWQESYPSLRHAVEAAAHVPAVMKPVRRADGRWILVPA